jgi:hypothetical protein
LAKSRKRSITFSSYGWFGFLPFLFIAILTRRAFSNWGGQFHRPVQLDRTFNTSFFLDQSDRLHHLFAGRVTRFSRRGIAVCPVWLERSMRRVAALR